MKSGLAIIILSLTVCVAGPAVAQQGLRGPTGNIDPEGESDTQLRAPRTPLDPEQRAEELRLAGKCQQAIPIYRRMVARGGFEIAQFHLGLCLLDVGKAEPDAQRAAALKQEAVDTILKAANGGLANAQIQLVSIYLDGVGVAADPVEAGKWALIYHANGSRFVIHLPDISPELQARLDNVLNGTSWAEAQSRANSWSPTTRDWDASR
ncbi:MAG TPA: hypothetical protein VGJ08_03185 [Rhizomicrobium sp.]|jgi:hypothetical protein